MRLSTIDLGRMAYAAAYDLQLHHHAEVLTSRQAGTPEAGRLLLVEHDPPVITITRRDPARANLLASPALLARKGVTLAETDRGGDITYHGPGQLVCYPVVDLNRLGLNLHAYMRRLETAVTNVCAQSGIATNGREVGRDPTGADATGVWVWDERPARKIAALGVRIRRWVTLHGLALNVTTNLEHFDLIVPCGLPGRGVTSLERELGAACPAMRLVKERLVECLSDALLPGQTAAVSATDR